MPLLGGCSIATMSGAMTRELLSAEDAGILALESGTVRGHTCKVIVIAGERSAEQVRAHLAERLGAVPQLTQRLDPGPGPPAWIEDRSFALERHVVDRGALDDVGFRHLVGTAMGTQLDREHPLWAMDVVSPLPGGRSGLVWRIHHAVADGMTAMRMARDLLLDAVAKTPAAGVRPPRNYRPANRRARWHRPSGGRQTRPRRCVRSWGGAPRHRRSTGASARVARSPSSSAARRVAAHRARRPRARDRERRGADRGGRGPARLARRARRAGGATAGEGAGSLHQPGEPDAANRDSYMVVDLPLEQTESGRGAGPWRGRRATARSGTTQRRSTASSATSRTCPARSSVMPSTGR